MIFWILFSAPFFKYFSLILGFFYIFQNVLEWYLCWILFASTYICIHIHMYIRFSFGIFSCFLDRGTFLLNIFPPTNFININSRVHQNKLVFQSDFPENFDFFLNFREFSDTFGAFLNLKTTSVYINVHKYPCIYL